MNNEQENDQLTSSRDNILGKSEITLKFINSEGINSLAINKWKCKAKRELILE